MFKKLLGVLLAAILMLTLSVGAMAAADTSATNPVPASDNGEIIQPKAYCRRCGQGPYLVTTEKIIDDPLYSRCVHYKHGEDVSVRTTYITNMDCPDCGDYYTQERDSVKETCNGYS